MVIGFDYKDMKQTIPSRLLLSDNNPTVFVTRDLVGIISITCKYALEKESILLWKNGSRCLESVKDR